ncbi:MAG TPA: metallopeptidase TldD-related protein, partial [Bryobacterales bacterium]|nr:metallopeptidase TldD-related protein [Bryobacterales bacterium]
KRAGARPPALARVVPPALLLILCCAAASTPEPFLLKVMQEELGRNFHILREKADPPPYFISYSIAEQQTYTLAATLGALTSDTHNHSRLLDITVRVGDYKLDNYHRLRRQGGLGGRFGSGAVTVSLDNDADSLQASLWAQTDRKYRQAAERLTRIKTDRAVKVEEEDSSADFSREEPVAWAGPRASLAVDGRAWAERLKKLSVAFRAHPQVLASKLILHAESRNESLVNTEGTAVQHGRNFLRLMITAQARAEDGMNLDRFESFEAADPSGFPPDSRILATIETMARDLEQLRDAPVAEPFVGPAILSGRASGVFFHEILGHRIEGHRQKDEAEGQTFARKLGEPILPPFLSVVFDPLLKKHDGVELNGWYDLDDEGVKARPVTVVDHGILKTFLMTRSPVAGVASSNGHARRQPGLEVVARQSNLLVESARQVPDAELRRMLIAEIRRQNKPYGLYFRDIEGGFTTTTRAGPQAFKVIPLVVYRVYADGKPDELIRGVDIVGTPLAAFAKILATSDRTEVFNGYCGAESGSVPVSAISPAILVSEMEIEKQRKAQDRPPLLPPPT